MRKYFGLWLSFIIAFLNPIAVTSYATAAQPESLAESTNKLFVLIKDSRTVGDFVDRLEGKLEAAPLAFVKQKLKAYRREKFEVRKVASKRLEITVARSTLPIEFVGPVDGSETRSLALVNNQEVELDSEATPEENFSAIEKVMPKKSAAIWNLILPEAEAQFDMSMLMMPIMVYAMMEMMRPPTPAYYSYPPGCYPSPSVGGAMICGAGPAFSPSYYSPAAPYYSPYYNGPLVRPPTIAPAIVR